MPLRITGSNCQEKQNSVDYETVRVLIEENKENVVLDFSAPWCKPCKKVYPILQAISEKYTDIYFFKIDIGGSDKENIGEIYNITTLPTVIGFHNGKDLTPAKGISLGCSNIIESVSELIGLAQNRDKQEIVEEINKYLLEIKD
ncbi:unnamed protein product [marine sediment metagenome]|uniref:Thioredoxin domain-containing protein n=1 Tax=marine sediment metagenome TaxID=412755 RepID=X0T710_9ZZZZ